MSPGQTRTIVAIVAAAISFIGMCVTILVALKNRKSTRASLEIQHFNATQAVRTAVREWGDEVLAVLSEATILCELDPARTTNFFEKRNIIRSRLSELADRGRWFFENDKKSGYGSWNGKENQEIAPVVIDKIKEALKDHVEKLNYKEINGNPSHRQPIVDLKKDIVAIIQQFISPERAHKELEEIRRSIT